MKAYTNIARWMVIGLYMSHSIPIYSMNDELSDPVSDRPQNSYLPLGINSQWASRYCPNFLRFDRMANRVPIIAPTHSSSVAIVSSKYSRKQIAMIAGLTIGAGFAGYFIGSTCKMCTTELKNAQQYVGEMDKAFNACEDKGDELTEAVTYLTNVVYNLTVQCVDNIGNVKDTIIEYCTK